MWPEGKEKPWAPTATELAAYTGRYFSEEMETFFEVAVKEGKLVLVNRRTDPVTFVPGARDRFDGSGDAAGTTLAFERDRNGRIIAFYAANGRARDVRFARVP